MPLIMWLLVYWLGKPGKITNLEQATWKPDHIKLYQVHLDTGGKLTHFSNNWHLLHM